MNNSRHAHRVVLVSALLCSSFLVCGLFHSARAQEPEPPASTTRGIQLYEQGDLQGAAKILEEVVAKRPDDADAWYYPGLARYRQGWIGQRVPRSSAWLNSDQIPPTAPNLSTPTTRGPWE